MPLITTIIPTYKRPERLRKAIQSVLNQTFQDFQVCVYDNASGDDTAKVVAEFAAKDPRVKYHCHERNIGAIENFQYGITRVDTPYFSLLSDDDFLLPEFYKTTLQGFEKYPDAALSLGAVTDIEDNGEVIRIHLSDWPDREYYPVPHGLFEMISKYSGWTGTLFRTDLACQVNGLDLSIRAMDVDFCFRIAARFPLVISKSQVAVFVSHSGSYSRDKGLKLFWPGFSQMIDNLNRDEHLSKATKEGATRLLKKELEIVLLKAALRSLELGNYQEAEQAVKYYKETSRNRLKKSLLTIVVKTCTFSRSLHWCFTNVFQLRRALKRSIIQRRLKIGNR